MTQILPPKPWGGPPEAFSVRFPSELAEEIRRLAKAHGYSVNELMNFIVDWGVKEIRRQDAEREAEKKQKR